MEAGQEKVTIEISKKMYDDLMEVATEMTTQDMRGTKMPHMFQIRDWKKVYDAELNGDTKIWLDRGNGLEIETVEGLIDYFAEDEFEFDEIKIREMWDSWNGGGYNDDLKDWLEEHVPNIEEYSYSLEPEYTNCFLTAKAAQKHLDANHYHYHKNADVYLNCAWRNVEAEIISTFLCNLVGKEMYR